MKTKLEIAHDYAKILLAEKGVTYEPANLARTAWQYADAMQAEADKRNIKLEEDPSNFSGIMKAKVDAELYGNGFVKLKIINNEFLYERLDPTLITINHIEVDDWQPDWSQAPDGYDWFIVGGCSGKGYFCLIKPTIVKDHYWFVGEDCFSIDKHGYQGDWRNSLRKRPK